MRAPPLLLLLLMAAAGLAQSPLARLNPWLSACDLEQEGAGADCGAACGGGGPALRGQDVARLCALAAGARARRLAELRLRACCERSPASALDRSARADVQAGGARCQRTLRDLLALDALVARVHCDFLAILQRYDCDQPYSVHTCDECQETYRRWACSTMVPLWVEEGSDEGEERTRRAAELPERDEWAERDEWDERDEWEERDERSSRGEERAERGERGARAAHAERWRSRHLERVGHLDRRRAGGVGRAVRGAAAGPGRPLARLKPCLAVCQRVEQHCPYFLPADRAPAYPTQYAGEPTFLCLDPRIPETGGQANKSNYGWEECCYWHCEGRLCYECSARLREATAPAAEACAPVDARPPACAAPYAAAGGRARPTLLPLLLALAALCRTPWPPPLVNVRDSRL